MAGPRRPSGQRKPRMGNNHYDDDYNAPYEYGEDDLPPSPPRRKRASKKDAIEKKSLTFGGIIWYLLTLPFRIPWVIIKHLTRNMRSYLVWPMRIFLSFAFAAIVVIAFLIFQYGTIAYERYDISEITKMPERTIVLDRKNREIGRLHGENRKQVTIEQIPPVFIDALLLREDKRFYNHGGVDWVGVARAFEQVFKHNRATQGASTLTMQLAKNTYNHQERSLHNKLIEIALAFRIESTYSKKDILEAYINRIFWGHTFMGISAASRGYFNKEPYQLTVGECAMLAGIIYGPNQFSPYKSPENAKYARDLVLGLLKDANKITEEQYQAALLEPIVTNRPQSRSEENYMMDLIRQELDNILEDEDIRLGGLVVRTTLDLDLQNIALDSLNKHLEQLESHKGYPHKTRKEYLKLPENVREKTPPDYVQGAVVVMDNANGGIIVLVGGRDAEESRFNRAIQSRRQVGSLFKPFVYTAFFEKGYSPSTLVSDNRIAYGEIKGAPRWSPRNSDNTYQGNKPASFGLIKSRNTMSVRVGQVAGLQNIVQRARLCGFPGKVSVTPALFLGTWEAAPRDVASAYSVFANGGVRPTPYIVETIDDSSGKRLFRATKTSRIAYSPSAANKTSSLLQQVTKPGGTAGRTQSMGFKAPCGGKTGTTNNYMNAWFAGYTSQLSSCVWIGFDKQKKIIDQGYGGTLALPVWVDVMKAAEKEGYPCKDIRTAPAKQNQIYYMCRDSHQIAHTGCKAAHTAYFEDMPVNPPKGFCTVHIPLAEELDANELPLAQPVNGGEYIPVAEPVDNEDIPIAEPVYEDDRSDIPVAIPVN